MDMRERASRTAISRSGRVVGISEVWTQVVRASAGEPRPTRAPAYLRQPCGHAGHNERFGVRNEFLGGATPLGSMNSISSEFGVGGQTATRTVVHELGHAFGCPHDCVSLTSDGRANVMYSEGEDLQGVRCTNPIGGSDGDFFAQACPEQMLSVFEGGPGGTRFAPLAP